MIYFRIIFGLCLFGHTLWAYFPTVLESNYVEPVFHFKFYLFDWVPVPSSIILYSIFSLALLSSLSLAAGYFVRASAAVLAFVMSWFLLMDSTYFQNHYYFICLLCLIMTGVPSLPSKWQVYLLRFQFAVVYLFGGIAKINADWLSGKPMTLALSALAQEQFVPSFVSAPAFVQLVSIGGLIFDLSIIPLLCYQPTRKGGIVLLCGFHLTNMGLWGLGIFPWLMLLGTMVLFCFDECESVVKKILSILRLNFDGLGGVEEKKQPGTVAFSMIVIWVLFQILMPLRQFLYSGPTRWHQQGDYFAWTMKLNQYNHLVEYEFWNDAAGSYEKIPYRSMLSYEQEGTLHDPDHILQFAHYLQKITTEKTGKKIQIIRTRAFVSVNSKELQLMIDPEVNILNSERQFAPHPWVLPYKQVREM